MYRFFHRSGNILAILALFPFHAYASDGNYVLDWFRIPLVEAVIAAIIFVSILAEIKTAGFSGGGLVAVIAGGILLGSHWYTGEIAWFEFLLYFGGVAFILLDIFVFISGFGIMAGLVSMIGGLYLTFGADVTALWVLSAAIILAIIIGYFLIGHLSQSRLWKRLALTMSLTSANGYVSSYRDLERFKGKEGIATTVLRPSGKVQVEGEIIDAISEGTFIQPGEKVKILRVEGNHLVVK